MTDISHNEGAVPCLQELQERFDSLRSDLSCQLAKVRRKAPQRTLEVKQRDSSLTAVSTAPRHHGSAAVDRKTKRSVGSKPRTRFRAAQENRALSENQPLQRLKAEANQRSIDQDITVEWPKRTNCAKRKQKEKAKKQQWKNDFAGASREPSPERSPAESPEWKGMSGVQESISVPSVRNAGMRETTLSCIRSSHDRDNTDSVDTNPKARFDDDISLDCMDDDLPSGAMLSPPGQLFATDPPPPRGCTQDANFRVNETVGTPGCVSDTAQSANAAQLPLVGNRHMRHSHSTGPGELPSQNRSTIQAQSEAYRSHASHGSSLPAVEHGPPAASASMPAYSTQAANPQVWQSNATFTEQLPRISGCPDSSTQQASSTCDLRGLPFLNSSSQFEPCLAQSRSDAGHHHHATMMHEARQDMMPAQRKFSTAQNFHHPQQRQGYYNTAYVDAGFSTRPSCPSLTDRTPVFDAYSQGFRFPRCEDAWAAVQASNTNRGGGALLTAAGQSHYMQRSKLSRATSPGALLGNTHERASDQQNCALRKRRQWFDPQDRSRQGGSVWQSHAHAAATQQPALGVQQQCQGPRREEEERAWNARMAAVRSRLAALAAERNAHSHGMTLAASSATDTSSGNPSNYNYWQGADWGHAPGVETPPRSLGRRPVGPGDAFQGQSLAEVLKSTPSRSPKPNQSPQPNVATGDGVPNEDRTPMRARRHTQNDSAMASALDSFGGLSLGELMPARREDTRSRPAAGLSSTLQHQQQRSRPRVGSMTAADLQPQPYWGSHDSGGDAWMINSGQNGATAAAAGDVGSGCSKQHGLGALALLERVTHGVGACGQSKADIEDAQECSICLDVFKSEQVLRRYKTCGHSFHERCIVEWLARGDGRCPYCRGNP